MVAAPIHVCEDVAQLKLELADIELQAVLCYPWLRSRDPIPPVVRESLDIETGDVVETTVRKMELAEKEKSQSINPLMAAETLIPVSAWR